MQILRSLQKFIEPHPDLHPEAGGIFTPRREAEIRFFFEGGASVVGSGPKLEINFNDDDLLILATGSSVYRFKKSALVGFELVHTGQEHPAPPDQRGLRLVSSKK